MKEASHLREVKGKHLQEWCQVLCTREERKDSSNRKKKKDSQKDQRSALPPHGVLGKKKVALQVHVVKSRKKEKFLPFRQRKSFRTWGENGT